MIGLMIVNWGFFW